MGTVMLQSESKLVRLIRSKSEITVGVLETPEYPAAYYGGRVLYDRNSDTYYPYAHEKGFFVTEEAAAEAALIWPLQPKTTIVGVAIRYGLELMFKLKPWRHQHIIQEHGGSGDQGFITSRGQFVNRLRAKEIAVHAHQIRPGCGRLKELYSEAIW